MEPYGDATSDGRISIQVDVANYSTLCCIVPGLVILSASASGEHCACPRLTYGKFWAVIRTDGRPGRNATSLPHAGEGFTGEIRLRL